ncbi:MAG: extracellular solute-binding protein [Bradyrhizobiaceae bacterium]|nr:extracellular solute-binding protein [Bradyrhizobiaceae bacterium]
MWTKSLLQTQAFRHVVSAIAIGTIGIILGSCSSNNEHLPDAQTIRFWHFWSEPNQRTAIRELVAEYQRKHNTIVELTELSWNDGKTKLLAAFNSGSPPDVIELGSDWIAQFSSAGVLLALPTDKGVTDRFPSYSLVPAMWKGRLYAYPWTVDARLLYLNRDLLNKAGWKGAIETFADMQRAAELVKEHGAEGFGANGADAHRLYKKILPFMWSMGGDVLDSKGQLALNLPANVKAFELYADLARSGYIETQRQLDAAFLQGKVALWMSGSWLLPKIRAAKGLDVEAVLMPGQTAGTGISFAGGEYLAVSAATKNSQRSRELVEFLTSGAQALKLCQQISEAGFPADKSTSADASLMADTMKVVFAKQLEHSRMTPVHPHWLDVEALLENALVKVLLGQASAQASLDEAQTEALKLR